MQAVQGIEVTLPPPFYLGHDCKSFFCLLRWRFDFCMRVHVSVSVFLFLCVGMYTCVHTFMHIYIRYT